MSIRTKGRPTLNKTVEILKWLKANPNGMRADYIKSTDRHVSGPTFSRVKAKFKKGTEVSSFTKKVIDSCHLDPSNDPSFKLVAELRDEVSYLRWCNSGERKGWVKKLMSETASG